MNKQNYYNLDNKTVLITGAAKGLGAEIAMQYANHGANIILNYRSDFARAQSHANKIRDVGVKVIAVKADLLIEKEVEEMVEKAIAEFGKIDILINNAGIYPQNSVLDMKTKDWDNVIETNLKSAVLTSKFVANKMIESKTKGNIINISSIEAEQPAQNHSHYASSKAALNMFTKASANELASFGIRVNSVSPGLIARKGLEDDWPEGVAKWLNNCPLDSLIEAKDVANACIFLSSEKAKMITGVDVKIDGGIATNPYF